MSRVIRILGVDPSLSNFGCVLVDYDTLNPRYRILDMKLIETRPYKKIKGVRKNAMDLERCRLLADGFQNMTNRADAIIAEMPHGSQNARAAASYGMCLGILSICEKPLVQVTAEQVKLAACNDRVASKKEMIEWATNKCPDAPWIYSRGKFINKNEHLADALGAIEAGLQTEEWSALETLWRLNGRFN